MANSPINDASTAVKDDAARLAEDVKNLASSVAGYPRAAVLGELENATRKQPLKYLAYAVGVGLIAGILIR